MLFDWVSNFSQLLIFINNTLLTLLHIPSNFFILFSIASAAIVFAIFYVISEESAAKFLFGDRNVKMRKGF